jgi:hypothetical protein
MDPASAARHQLRRHNPGDALRWSLTCPLLPDHGSLRATGGGLKSVVVSTPSAARAQAPRESVVTALTSPDLASVVDLFVWVEVDADDPSAGQVAMAASHIGRVRLHLDGRHEVLEGLDPIASGDPMAFLPYERECASPGPRTSGRTPTRMPRRGSSRCSPTRPAALTSR